MALLQCNFFSQALMRTVPIQVVLPTDKTLGPGVHDWYFWDEYILKALNWLPLADAQQGISSGNVGV